MVIPTAFVRARRVSDSSTKGGRARFLARRVDVVPQTTIRFRLPESAQVRLVVYDVLGRPVRVLLDGTREAGTHEVVFEASNLPSGTYLVQLVTPAGSFVQTMQLVK